MNINEVTIRRMNKVFFSTNVKNIQTNSKEASAALGNLIPLGYWLNESSFKAAELTSVDELSKVIESSKILKGANVDYVPMYPNFPKQVAEASDVELFINAIMHYIGDWVGVRIIPDYSKNIRKPLEETVEMTVLGLTNKKELHILALNILEQGQPYSEADTKDLEVLKDFVDFSSLKVNSKVKENIAYIVVNFPEINLSESLKTFTDVLRVATAYSGGDISLAENTKFKLSRKNRRFIIESVNSILASKNIKNEEDFESAVEDFSRHNEKWKRLIKTLHISDYNYPLVKRAFSSVYNDSVKSFESKVQRLLSEERLQDLLNLLKTRPGTFARKIAELIRKYPRRRELILKNFDEISKDVSILVLVQMWNLFSGPTEKELENRSIIIKGKTSKSFLIPNRLVGDNSDVVRSIEKGLTGRNSDVKVFFDSDNNDYSIPLSNRSVSESLKVVGRGSRIRMNNDKNTLRMFIHWKDLEGSNYDSRVDLDLSALFVNEDFTNSSTVAYYNLRNKVAYHSGDITSAPNGAAEFIDINIDDALAKGWRYVLPTVYNYTGQKLVEVPEAWSGFMLRDKVNSGEIFEASTVEQKYSLTGETVNATPFVFDLKTKEMIWFDSSVNYGSNVANNVYGNMTSLLSTLISLVKSRPMTIEKLIDLTTTRVKNMNEADVIINPLEVEKVLNLLN